jgi:hypothetical protein
MMNRFFLITFAFYLKLASPTRLGCDFEKYCSDLDIDSFWGQTDGEHPFTSNYPNTDHTYKNSSGHYVFFNLNTGQRFTAATISFGQMFNTTSSNISMRLTFAYVLHGSKSVNLSLMLIQGDSEDLKSVWFNVNTFSNKSINWQTASIDLPKDAYKVRLSVDPSKLDSNSDLVLALDDIFLDEIENNKQESEITFYCDFEIDNCSFDNRMPLNWTRIQGSKSIQLPKFDHTLNSSNGFFLTSNQSNPSQSGLVQRVISQTMTVPQSDTSFCISFYYYIQSRNSNNNAVYVYVQPVNNSDSDHYKKGYLVWPPDTYLGLPFVYDKWSWAIANLIPGTFKVSFVYSSRNAYSTSVSIDDIKVSSCHAVNNKRTEYQLSAYFEYKCDFETDDCGFGNAIPYDNLPTNWTRTIASSASTYDPSIDHTLANSSGHYYKVNYSYPFLAEFSAAAQSVNIFSSIQHCIQFYFYANAETFNPKIRATFGISSGGCYGAYLYFISPFNSSDYADQWIKAIVHFREFSCIEFLLFSFSTTDFLRFGIAIDDVVVDRCDSLPPDQITTSTAAATSSSTIITTTSTARSTTTTSTTVTISTASTSTTHETTFISSVTTEKITEQPIEIITTSNSIFHSTTHKSNAVSLSLNSYLPVLAYLLM